VNSTSTPRRPKPILIIEILGYVGVAFWLSMIVRSVLDDAASAWPVILVGVVLGTAHIIISVGSSRRSRMVYAAMWFVLIGDSVLTVFVDLKAVALVLFTVVLLVLTRAPSARAWLAP